MSNERLLGTVISQSVTEDQFDNALTIILNEKIIERFDEKELLPIIYGNALRYPKSVAGLRLSKPDTVDSLNRRITSLYDVASDIITKLDSAGIQCLLLKNSAIGKLSKLSNFENPMGDIDFLVMAHDLEAVLQIMLDAGHKIIGDKSALLSLENRDEFEIIVEKSGFRHRFEFQTRPVSGRWISKKQEPSASTIWSGTRIIDDTNFHTLAPEILLLTVCLHTAKHSFVRSPGFRLHTDVDRLVNYDQVDWIKFIALVEKHRVKVPVYFSLYFAQEFLRTNIPADVIYTLRPSFLRRKFILHSLKNVGFLNPNENKWSRLGYVIFTLSLYDNFLSVVENLFFSKKMIEERFGVKAARNPILFNIRRIINLIAVRENH